MSPLGVWIDACGAACSQRVFGMPLLERLLRALREAGLEPAFVRIEHEPGQDPTPSLRQDLLETLPLEMVPAVGTLAERIGRAATGDAPLLVLQADAVVDSRLIAHVAEQTGSFAVIGGEGAERAAVLRLEAPLPGSATSAADLASLAADRVKGGLRELSAAEVPDYLPRLRRHLPAYCFRVPDAAACARAEHFLFWSNYKGSTDFFTRYVYPPFVWRSVGPLARWRVHPNWVSGLNVVITLAAVPLFAAGLFLPGLVLAWTMSVLDSVDGKLARLTYRASKLGHVLDHGLDVVHPPLWYLAWAWPLGDGDPASFVFRAALWMTGLYIADRLVTEAFTRATGRSIHAYSELDVWARTFISRRNINLPIFTVGWLVGAAVPAFLAIVAWQAATLVFHAVRLVQVVLGASGSAGSAQRMGQGPIRREP